MLIPETTGSKVVGMIDGLPSIRFIGLRQTTDDSHVSNDNWHTAGQILDDIFEKSCFEQNNAWSRIALIHLNCTKFL